MVIPSRGDGEGPRYRKMDPIWLVSSMHIGEVPRLGSG
jgi:hypothetical protein